MAINDVAGEWVYHILDILRESLGHNFVSGLRRIKTKNLELLKNLKT